MVVETMLTIGIVTANPEAIQARWKACRKELWCRCGYPGFWCCRLNPWCWSQWTHECRSPHPEWASPATTESGPTPIEPSFVDGTTGHFSGDKSPKRMAWWLTTIMEQAQKVNVSPCSTLRYTDVLFNRTPRSVCDVC